MYTPLQPGDLRRVRPPGGPVPGPWSEGTRSSGNPGRIHGSTRGTSGHSGPLSGRIGPRDVARALEPRQSPISVHFQMISFITSEVPPPIGSSRTSRYCRQMSYSSMKP